MLTRRILLAAIAASSAFAVAPAVSFERRTFDANAFQAAKSAGRSILIGVSAPWCPTCRAQKPNSGRTCIQAQVRELRVLRRRFRTLQKDVLRMLNVHQQSTLITFKGAKEVGRSTGETNAASIEDLLNKAI